MVTIQRWLGIEAVLLRQPAGEEDVDDRPGLARARRISLGAQGGQVAGPEPEQADGPEPEAEYPTKRPQDD